MRLVVPATVVPVAPSTRARFLSKITPPADSTACWLWSGGLGDTGYGYFYLDGRMVRPHRVAFQWFVGTVPSGHCVCHHCDVRPCVNPAHLFAATSVENQRDMRRKGRASRGEARWNARLTATDVQTIRARYAAGRVTHQALADAFGVALMTVNGVLRGRRWGHV